MSKWRFPDELVWAGRDTVRELVTNLEHRRRTVLKLPSDCHSALSARLYESRPTRGRIDVTGDATLLLRIAAVDEIAELAELAQPMRTIGARLRLRSPAPHLVFNFQTARNVAPEPGPREWQYGESWLQQSPAPLCGSCGVRLREPQTQYG
jgi:hypothetical protein